MRNVPARLWGSMGHTRGCDDLALKELQWSGLRSSLCTNLRKRPFHHPVSYRTDSMRVKWALLRFWVQEHGDRELTHQFHSKILEQMFAAFVTCAWWAPGPSLLGRRQDLGGTRSGQGWHGGRRILRGRKHSEGREYIWNSCHVK